MARSTKQDDSANGTAAAPDETLTALVAPLLDKAWALREEYDTWVKSRKANRTMLRQLAAQGVLSDEQMAELDEVYPERQGKADETETGADAAETAAAA